MSDVKQKRKLFLLSSSPHIVSPVNSKMLMGNMYIALAPVTIFAVIVFGRLALLNIVTAMASAIAGEALFRLLIKQPVRIKDLSAGITGLLLALVIPPTIPLWMTALGSFFAVIVAKEFFGGLGANIFNPALIGRAFLLMSFPAAMTTWQQPVTKLALEPDAVSSATYITGATPLGLIKYGDSISEISSSFTEKGLPESISYTDTLKTLFFGYHYGSAGETSIFLILASFLFLLITKTISWHIPVAMILSAFITSLFLDLGDPLFSILSGGLFFGAVFMATDYVTSPFSSRGKIIFGAGIGIISILIRKYGAYPEGVCYAILIMNAAVPFLNKILPRKYGYVKKTKPKRAAVSKGDGASKGDGV